MAEIPAPSVDGDERRPVSGLLPNLDKRIKGQVLRPGHPDYDAARQVWNAMIQREPALIVRCTDTSDVVEAVNAARDEGLQLSIRGGGHNIAGMAVTDGGLMIDLSPMKRIDVNESTRRVIVQPGAVWGDVDRATEGFNLVVPSGIISTTGVAGLTLGGGFGWLTRKWGHTADHLRSAEIVTADGQVLRASEQEHPDLFWGLRGGGGNFGVVTEFEFEARQLGSTIVGGLVFHPMDQAGEVIRFFREFTATAPEDLTCLLVLRIAPPAPFLPESVHGKPVAGIAVSYVGPPENGESVLKPLKEFGSPLADTIGPKPFSTHQSFLDSGQPHGRNYYWKSEFLPDLNQELDEVMIDYCSRFSSPLSSMLLMQQGGAAKRMPQDAGSFSHRDAEYVIVIQSAWEDPGENDRHIQWARDFHASIQPYSTGGTYVNFLNVDEGADRTEQAYNPETYARLREIKTRYDPHNLFRMNKNIEPLERSNHPA